MKPKIAYLIDESGGRGQDPDWKFYAEDAVPERTIKHISKDKLKRIVYWEIVDDHV